MLRDLRAAVVTNLNAALNCFQRLDPILRRPRNISIICERRGFLMHEAKHPLLINYGAGS